MTALRTRIAPTPSGFLHVGNAVNMVLTAWWAVGCGGRLLLRIDDFDVPRVRPEYLADIFTTLDWLGLAVDEGPSGPQEFLARWSMSARRDQFGSARDALLAHPGGAAFVCACSRRDLQEGRCARGCAGAGLELEPGRTLVRLHVPAGLRAPMTGAVVDVPAADHVLWRRDDLPAYHLGSVVADEALGVTAVLRGVDLLESSALQRHLAELLPAPGFAAADLRHHDLVTGPTGAKLSKSAGAQAHPLEREAGLRARIEAWAQHLGAAVGISRP